MITHTHSISSKIFQLHFCMYYWSTCVHPTKFIRINSKRIRSILFCQPNIWSSESDPWVACEQVPVTLARLLSVFCKSDVSSFVELWWAQPWPGGEGVIVSVVLQGWHWFTWGWTTAGGEDRFYTCMLECMYITYFYLVWLLQCHQQRMNFIPCLMLLIKHYLALELSFVKNSKRVWKRANLPYSLVEL